MKTLLLILTICSLGFSEIPITSLPAFTGAQVGALDVVPFVNNATNTTGQLKISQLLLVPSLQSPTFTGVLTVPTASFNQVTSPTGIFINVNINSPTKSYINCGSLSGAIGCVPEIINGTVHYVPYF